MSPFTKFLIISAGAFLTLLSLSISVIAGAISAFVFYGLYILGKVKGDWNSLSSKEARFLLVLFLSTSLVCTIEIVSAFSSGDYRDAKIGTALLMAMLLSGIQQRKAVLLVAFPKKSGD